MSQLQISHSQDLKLLQDQGYAIRVVEGVLIVDGVPYVNSDAMVEFGSLVVPLTLAGDVTAKPSNHMAYFIGSAPCDRNGKRLEQLFHSQSETSHAPGVISNIGFSQKPKSGSYDDYHGMVCHYIALIMEHAREVEPGVKATGGSCLDRGASNQDPFAYADTATSIAGISNVSAKLRGYSIAIIGLGGSGGYVLDLLAKTPVRQIRVFDGDGFFQHNAFRAPGAATIDELRERPKKVDYFSNAYLRMHRGIVAHNEMVTADSVDGQLSDIDFVFLCVDNSKSRKGIVEQLIRLSIPWVDVGMGLWHVADRSELGGQLRVTSWKRGDSERVLDDITFSDSEVDDPYEVNIQVAELNSLNAALAVIQWKRMLGFYRNSVESGTSIYVIDANKCVSKSASIQCE